MYEFLCLPSPPRQLRAQRDPSNANGQANNRPGSGGSGGSSGGGFAGGRGSPTTSAGSGGGGPLGGVFAGNEPDGGTVDLLASCVAAVLGAAGSAGPAGEEESADDTVAAFIADAARGEVSARVGL